MQPKNRPAHGKQRCPAPERGDSPPFSGLPPALPPPRPLLSRKAKRRIYESGSRRPDNYALPSFAVCFSLPGEAGYSRKRQNA